MRPRNIVLVEGRDSLHNRLSIIEFGHVDEAAGPYAREEAVLPAVVGDKLEGKGPE